MTQVAERWLEAELGVVELTPVRDRPWSAVWRVEARGGLWWLKENRAGTTYEPQLLALLTGVDGDLVPEVRVHPDRPWTLLADAGPDVRASNPEQQLDLWCALLPRYGELQRRVSEPALRMAGVPDVSAGRMVEAYAELLAEPGWLDPDRVAELTAEDLAAIRGCGPALAVAARQLAGGRPAALQHDDLHSGNVLATDPGDVRTVRVIDWGDASISHPFATLRVTLDVLADELGLDREAAPLRRVRDAYLEGWRTGGESSAALLEELDLVLRTAPLVRAVSWARALGGPTDDPEYADAVAHWLLRLARALPTGPVRT